MKLLNIYVFYFQARDVYKLRGAEASFKEAAFPLEDEAYEKRLRLFAGIGFLIALDKMLFFIQLLSMAEFAFEEVGFCF